MSHQKHSLAMVARRTAPIGVDIVLSKMACLLVPRITIIGSYECAMPLQGELSGITAVQTLIARESKSGL